MGITHKRQLPSAYLRKSMLQSLAQLPEDEPAEDADAWLEDMEDEEAPAEIHEYFDHIADLKKNNAVFVNVDGTISDAVPC